MAQQGLLVFISGPSGVGKSTVCRRLAAALPAEFAISATTRQGQPQDAFGKKYVFVDEAEFHRRLEARDFLEYANVFGRWYGTLKAPVYDALQAGRTVLLEIDVQGGMQVRKLFDRALGVFILPPSEEELLARLRSRGRDDELTIQRRFAEAKNEIASAKASGIYDVVVINGDGAVDQAVSQIKQAIERFGRSPAVRQTETGNE